MEEPLPPLEEHRRLAVNALPSLALHEPPSQHVVRCDVFGDGEEEEEEDLLPLLGPRLSV